MDTMKFYLVRDSFFSLMNDPYLKDNKNERRPHYCCFYDEALRVFWLIPLSSKIRKYQELLRTREQQHKPCDIVHIVKTDNGREEALLIQDMFPITEKHILREYTIAGNPMSITSERTRQVVEQKAKRVRNLLLRGVKFTPTQPNVLAMLDKLRAD